MSKKKVVFELGDKVLITDPQQKCLANFMKNEELNYYSCMPLGKTERIIVHESYIHKYKKLSEREREALQGFKDGLKNKELANFLGINEKTISTYKARCKKKMGLSNDDNDHIMVITGLKLGLIS